MKQSRVDIKVWVFIGFLILASRLARADGGVVQLREAQGPFLVTIFVSPEAAEGVTDVSILVQHKENADVVLDADVNLVVDPPADLLIKQSDPLCGLSSTAVESRLPEPVLHSVQLRATRNHASNKLLYAAPLKLEAIGDWRLHVMVSQGTDSARFDCLLAVARTSAGLA